MTTTTNPSSSHAWSPSDEDHLIYQLLKFEGKSQRQVASMRRISQATICRIVQRYERWQAHTKGRAGGRLDPQERLRAQRWLTYERNELILASCLRIAQEMEGFTDVSKRTTRQPIDHYGAGGQVSIENRLMDRSGVAARFLRLAFRVNMEQLKLAALLAQDNDAPVEPLSDEELAAELRQAAAEIAAGHRSRHRGTHEVGRRDEPNPDTGPPAPRSTEEQQGSGVFGEDQSNSTDDLCPPKSPDPLGSDHPDLPSTTLNLEPGTSNSTSVNHLNQSESTDSAATSFPACTCMLRTGSDKSLPCSCIIDCD